MTDNLPPPPAVDPNETTEVAPGVYVIGDRRVPLVPNIGIVLGRDAALVVDTGMGPENGRKVLDVARRLAGDRKLILTLTHFHPEHGFGAQAFKGAATILYNSAQRDELAAKGAAYLGMFRGFGPGVAAALEGAELVMPDEVYEGASRTIDLGGRVVELATYGLAHTKGDQVVSVGDAGVVFVGDLAEERIFPIFPWFPPDDADIDADNWASVLAALEAARPKIVVPGHGSVGAVEILSAVRGYMLDLGSRVTAEVKAGKSADEIVASLGPRVRAEHPAWEAPEWIDFAIRYFAAKA
ncbi:MBL fold metallo-hydrolase [Mesorhizobium sp. VK25A]|uniref:MBL fold metallo-hydrolase n=1 Tax=Mesorhizobium vachelliae TaxID=3072309 RepID=A0ABU5A3N6_9HYPH|nr:MULTISPECIES: MBL fold metallo-hydrolase [unclassified Mesorhizobium]MDX8532268.1 MBL fold metallo-hydrolase [Mesorhizobium sp. VK25D]MDX8545428.1 MBL fold metallo-hydrolase [Mesorhizobium sp. VK25A]